MEKENFQKYYELIASLVKEHKKYDGLESILDDIVTDVYEHASVVLNSVTNDDVLESYLRKVVATSIITVPKKKGLSISTKKVHPCIDLTRPVLQEDSIEEKLEDNVIPETVTFEVADEIAVDTEINALEEESEVEDEVAGIVTEEYKDAEMQEVESLVFEQEEVEDETVETDDVVKLDYEQDEEEFDLIEQEEAEEPLLEDIEEVLAQETEQTPDVDMSLVEKMINGVEVLEFVEKIEYEKPAESVGEEFSLPVGEALSPSLEEEPEQVLVESDLLELNTCENTFEALDDEIELNIDDELIDNSVKSLEILEVNSEITEDIAIENSEVIFDEEQVDLFEESDNDIEKVVINYEKNNLSEYRESENIDIFVNLFSDFDFNTEEIFNNINEYYDGNIIGEELLELNATYPDYHILEVFKLRFVEGLPINNIADTLNLSTTSVIDVLNVIIDIVKD